MTAKPRKPLLANVPSKVIRGIIFASLVGSTLFGLRNSARQHWDETVSDLSNSVIGAAVAVLVLVRLHTGRWPR